MSRLRRTPKTTVVERSVIDQRPPAWQGLFLGAGLGGGVVVAGPQQSALVLGPPRSGKTTCLIIPNVLIAPGAVVSTSTKTDVASATMTARGRRGRCWLFDPSGTLYVPDGITPLRWSPVPGAEDWTAAVATAHAIASAATRHARRTSDSDHWAERAEALLAPFLHAAALRRLDVEWVLRWALRRETTEPAGIILNEGGHELAAETLAGIAATDEKERSGIFSTACGLLAAYRSPAALDVARQPNFDPDAFARSSDTVYICTPSDDQDQLAPLVVALLERLRRATYRRTPGWPPVVWALDEVANIAPLPGLPGIVSEGASQGLIVLACLQDLSQARTRWDRAADGFLTLFGWKVLLPGIADGSTLHLVSSLAGDHYVRMQSTTRTQNAWFAGSHPPTVTTHLERRPLLPPDAINRLTPGTALTFGPNTGPATIDLIPHWRPPFNTAT